MNKNNDRIEHDKFINLCDQKKYMEENLWNNKIVME
jgi:hypothetical protein